VAPQPPPPATDGRRNFVPPLLPRGQQSVGSILGGAGQPPSIAGGGTWGRLCRPQVCGQLAHTGGPTSRPTNLGRHLAAKRRRRLGRQVGPKLGRDYSGLVYCPGGNKHGQNNRWRRRTIKVPPGDFNRHAAISPLGRHHMWRH